MISAGEFVKWCAVFGIPFGGGGGSGTTEYQVQQGIFNKTADTGIDGNAYIGTLSPAPLTYTDNLIVWLKPNNANNSPVTLQLNGLAAKPIVDIRALPIAVGAMFNNVEAQLVYNSTIDSFVLQNPLVENTPLATSKVFIGNGSNLAAAQTLSGSATIDDTGVITVTSIGYGVDSGATNAIQLTFNTDPGTYAGMTITFECSNNNTGATTIQVDALGSVPMVLNGNVALTGGELVSGNTYIATYNADDAAFILINSSLAGGGVTAPQVQQSAFNIGIDSGVADAYVVALSPVISALTDGLTVEFTPLNSSLTTSPTVDVGTGALSIFGRNYSALKVGDFVGGIPASITYNFSDGSWQLNNPQSAPSGVTPDQVQQQTFTYAPDTGSTNAIVVALAPTILSNGTILGSFLAANTNTGATTIDFGFGALDLVTNPNNACVGGEIVNGGLYQAMFNGNNNNYVLLNSSLSSGGGVTATQVQQLLFNHGIDSGTADNYNVALSPTATALTHGMIVVFNPLQTNTTISPVITVDGIGPYPILLVSQGSPVAGDINQFTDCILQYDDTQGYFNLMNPIASFVAASQVQNNYYSSAADLGSANAYDVSNLYPVQSSPYPGQIVWMRSASVSNTGASTLTNGVWTKNIALDYLTALVGGEILAQHSYFFMFNNTYDTFVLLNPSTYVSSVQVQHADFNIGIDSGAADAYVVSMTPTLLAYSDGLPITFTPLNSNATSTPTVDIDGLGIITITGGDYAPLNPNDLLSGIPATIIYNAGNGSAQLLNPQTATAGSFLPLSGGTMTGNIVFSGTRYLDNLTGIRDANNNLVLKILTEPSAVNYFTMVDNITGFPPVLSVDGTDTDIDLNIGGKGTGGVNILGVRTNALALTGYVGEVVSSQVLQAAGVSLTTATSVDVTSVPLTAGDWDIYGNIVMEGSTGNITIARMWSSTASATLPDNSQTSFQEIAAGFGNWGVPIPTTTLNISSPTTVYLSCQATFAVGTVKASGGILARRVR